MQQDTHRIPLSLSAHRVLIDNARHVEGRLATGELPAYNVFVDRLFNELRMLRVEDVMTLLKQCFDGESLDLNAFTAALTTAGDDPTMSMLHAAIGCSGESGELLDVVKKVAVYRQRWTDPHKEDGRELMVHVLEELADHRFYYQKALNMLGITDQQVVDFSYCKLSKRYASGFYSDAQAAARADKPGTERNFIGRRREDTNEQG